MNSCRKQLRNRKQYIKAQADRIAAAIDGWATTSGEWRKILENLCGDADLPANARDELMEMVASVSWNPAGPVERKAVKER